MASAYSATRWVLLSSFGFRFISLGGQMLILRLVDKDAFGIYRGLVLVHLILLIALPFSLDTLVVREKRRMARFVLALTNVLAWTGGFFALGLLALSLLPGPTEQNVLARLLGLGDDYLALYLMPLIVLLQAAKLSARSVLTATLSFKQISIGEFGNGLITWLGGAAIVVFYPTSLGLMAMYLAGELFECWWVYRNRPWRFPRILSPQRARAALGIVRQHLRYCLFNTSNLVFNIIASLLPGILFLALISGEANADFQVAQQLLVLPTMLLAGALYRVVFPSLSGVSESELQRRCAATLAGATTFIAPSVIWFAAFAPTTVMILAGEKYMDTTPGLVRWMSIYMILVCIYMPISSLDMLRNRPDTGLYWNIVYTLGRILIIYALANDGLLATVAAISVFSLIMWVVHIYIYGWLLRARWRDFLGSVLAYVPVLVLLGVSYWFCLWVTDNDLWLAPALSILPSLIYLGIILRFYPREAAMFKKMLNRRA